MRAKAFDNRPEERWEDMRLKIGEFARLAQVSVSALRFYSEVGLLKPAHTDRWTSYRYYDLDQLAALNRILALKDLGLSLDEIRVIMGDELSAEQLRGMLRLKHVELQQQANEIAARLKRVDARIQQIEMEGKMPDYDVVLKRVAPIRGAMLTDVVPRPNDSNDGSYNQLFHEVADHMRKHGASNSGPLMDLWYDTPGDLPEEMRVTVVIPTENDFPATERISIGELPAVVQMVSVVHRGSFTTIGAANVAALRWIEQNGYEISGPGRGIYLHYEKGGDPAEYVTEIQFPVEKR